jgi:predicted secreted protein
MSYIEIFVTFVCVWWLVIFFVLPFGNKWEEEGQTQAGLAKSAPKNASFKKKAKITTLITLVLTTVAYFVMSN